MDDLSIAAAHVEETDYMGRILAIKNGVVQFLGRIINKERNGDSSLNLRMNNSLMVGIIGGWLSEAQTHGNTTEVERNLQGRIK